MGIEREDTGSGTGRIQEEIFYPRSYLYPQSYH